MSRSVFSTLPLAVALALGSAPVWAQDTPDDPIGEDPTQDDPLDPQDDELPPDDEIPTTPDEQPTEEDPFDDTAPPPDQPVEPVEPVEPIEPVEPVEPIEPIEPEAVPPPEPLPQPQPAPQPPPPTQQPMYQPANPDENEEGVLTTPMGMSISLGGGLAGFVDDDFRDVTDLGGGWDLRLVTGTRMPVALELAYFGSAQNIEALGLDDDAVLLSNGGEAALRLNFANFADTEMYGFQPYVMGGAALRRYSIVNESFNTSNINSNDTIFEVPVGGGLSFRAAQVILDVRGSYRFSFDEDIIDEDIEAAEDASAMDSWNVFLTGGVEF